MVAAGPGRPVVGDHWLIEEGLKPGDRVVVEGFQKLLAGDWSPVAVERAPADSPPTDESACTAISDQLTDR